MACTSCQNLGTPGQYVSRAHRLLRQGHPGARKAALEAVVAVRAAEFAKRGDSYNAARAVKALRALRGLGDGPRDPARAAARIRELSQRTVTQATGTIDTIRGIATGVAGLVGAIGTLAISDPRTRADFDLVMGWIRAFISGTIPASMRTDAEAMRVMTIICAGWSVLGPLVDAAFAFWATGLYTEAGAASARRDAATATQKRNEAVAVQTFALQFVGFINGLCSDPLIAAALAPPPPPLPDPGPAPTADAMARREWRSAIVDRLVNEAILDGYARTPPANETQRQQKAYAEQRDCITSGRLRAANDALEARGITDSYTTTGTGGRTINGPMRIAYINRRPSTGCPVPEGYGGYPGGGDGDSGGGSSGGGGLAIAAGAAAVAALFLFMR